MTTTPERLASPFLFRVLDAMLTQKPECPFRLVLFVPHQSLRTGEDYPDPAFLSERYAADRLAVHRCRDLGPATKFGGLLTYLPEVEPDVTHVYIADDDIILRDGVFHRMRQRLQHRWRWWRSRLVLANDVAKHGSLTLVAGYAGILVPMGFFRDLAQDQSLAGLWNQLAMKDHPCFNVDDILLSRLFQRFGYRVERTGMDPFTDVMDRKLTDEHPEWFELCKHTMRESDHRDCLSTKLP